MVTPNYAALDAARPWKQKAAWMADVHDAGFKHITEMVHKTYEALGTTKETAKELGLSRDGVCQILHYIGVSVKPKGGRNNTVLTAALVRELRIGWDGVGVKKDYIRRFREAHGLTCHVDTLKMALDGRTWGCV